MATTIGLKGLLNADLVIVQNTTFSCTFNHLDGDGQAIDHTGWSAWCAMRSGGGTTDLTSYVTLGSDGTISLLIPDETTATLGVGRYDWDMIVEDDAGYATRIAYGLVTVYDSLSRD